MKCIKDLARMSECFEPDNQEEWLFVKFDDNSEDAIYRDIANGCDDNDYAGFNRWLKDEVGVTDYSVYTYLMSDENELKVGDTYEDSNDFVWERIG